MPPSDNNPKNLQGAICWAVAPYIPEAPFRTCKTDGSSQAVYETVEQLAQSVRGRAIPGEQTFLVPGKLRPVLILQSRPAGRLQEYAALRLQRLKKLPASLCERIRAQQEVFYYYLPKDRKQYGLPVDNAVDLNSLLRIHSSAILPKPLGYLDAYDFQAISERLVQTLDLDIGRLLAEAAIDRLTKLRTVTHKK